MNSLKQVKLSIGIPTYNQGVFLRKTIESVLNQTIAPYEIVVSNNHSDDGITDEVLNEFKNYIKVINPPVFLSMMENWNFLSKNLTGSHISLISSDDFYEPNFVETFLNIVKYDGVLYRFGFNLVDDKNKILAVKTIKSAKRRTTFPQNFYEQIRGPKTSFAAFVVSNEKLKKVNYFDDKLKLYGDWGLWLKLATQGTFYYCNKVVSNYRTEYRPTISKNRFFLSVSDYFYIYAVLQKKIINEYKLKPNVNKNAIKLHDYKIELDKKKFEFFENKDLNKLRKLIDGTPINTHFEYRVRSFLQNFREYFLKA